MEVALQIIISYNVVLSFGPLRNSVSFIAECIGMWLCCLPSANVPVSIDLEKIKLRTVGQVNRGEEKYLTVVGRSLSTVMTL